MKKKLVAPHLDFADSVLKNFYRSEDANLTVNINSWDAKILRIVFFHVIDFSYRLGSDPQDLYELETCFVEDKLMQIYGCIPINHSFKFFQLEDIDDIPIIQVLAESVIVTKE